MKTTATLETHLGQPSWTVSNDCVQARVTRLGGMLGPVTFNLGGREAEPLAVAPWCNESLPPGSPAVMRAMRGDFFCLPFGFDPAAGTALPPHGHTANEKWRLQACEQADGRARLSLAMSLPKGAGIEKNIELRPGQTALYVSHTLRGLTGRQSYGHHPILQFPAVTGSGVLSTSPIRFGQVAPFDFEDPAKGGYSSLRKGAWFRRLDRVPLQTGGFADLTSYPQHEGFENLVMVAHDPDAPFAWTAVVHAAEGYTWFSLKNPALLPSTVLWMSNGGRHYPPWNGRHRHVMGVEDVCSYFNLGRGPSIRDNPWRRRGAPTCVDFGDGESTTIPIIFGVAATPAGFGRVREITPTKGGIVLVSETGRRVRTAVDLSFLNPAVDRSPVHSKQSPAKRVLPKRARAKSA